MEYKLTDKQADRLDNMCLGANEVQLGHLLQELQSQEVDITYTNENKTPIEVGGIPKGTTFNDKTVQEMFNMLLYPAVAPTIGDVIVTPRTGAYYEWGSEQKITEITVNISKGSYNIKKVEVIIGNQATYSKQGDDLNDINSGKENVVIFNPNLRINSNTMTTSLSVKVYYADNSFITKNVGKFTFVHPYYYGCIGDPGVIDVSNLTPIVKPQGTQTVSYTATNERLVFLSYYEVSKITETTTGYPVDAFEKQDKTITIKGYTYYVYILRNATTVTDYKYNFLT